LNEADVKARAFAMPLTSPAFPPGPYRFVDREYLSGAHILTDLTLGLGTVAYDYLG
jgi:acetoacetate decarboxylase